ncbi:MAG: TRAP transporter small permease [Pseudomonadota bacterium]
MSTSAQPTSRLSRRIDDIEESLIAIILGLMTLVTFANVIARYVFNSNILWALETTVFLFAWLVLIGISYCVKKNANLGVDVLVVSLPPGIRRIVTLLAVLACLTFSVLLMIGSWAYWLPFFGERSWYETDDIPVPELLQLLAPALNEGERWSKLPRFIPYFALPLGMTLLTFRFLEVAWRVIRGEQDLLIASHEAEEMIETLGNDAAQPLKKGN